jgi:DUF4097 and DUF4098 domain-containing protein YvlB
MRQRVSGFGFLLSGILVLVFSCAAAAQSARYFREADVLVRQIAGNIAPSGEAKVKVITDIGNIHAARSADALLHYDIRVRVRGDEASARAQADLWSISVTGPGPGNRSGTYVIRAEGPSEDERMPDADVELNISVPTATQLLLAHADVGNFDARSIPGELRVDTGAGNVAVADIAGPCTVTTASGNVTADGVGGAFRATSGGGNIYIPNATSAINVESGGGSVRIGHAGGEVRAETGGGTIEIDSAATTVIANTGGGNLRLGKIAGHLRCETGGGNIRVLAAHGARCESGSGNIELRQIDGPVHAETGTGEILAEIVAQASTFGDSLLEAGSGDITVFLPPRLPVTVQAEISGSRGHHLISDFAELQGRTTPEDEGDELNVEARLNGGGPVLRLVSSSSDITVKKTK